MNVNVFSIASVVLLCTCLSFLKANAQQAAELSPLERGREFWVSPLPWWWDTRYLNENYRDEIDPRVHPEYFSKFSFVIVIYSRQSTKVDISIPRSTWKRTILTGDSSAYRVEIPLNFVIPFHFDKPEDIGVLVKADRPITLTSAGGHHSSGSWGGDAALVFPKEMLGREYHIGSHHTVWFHGYPKPDDRTGPWGWYHDGIVILATEDDTKIKIKYSSTGWNEKTDISLQRGQTHIISRDTSYIENTIITSSKPIAVFTQGVFGWPGININGFTGAVGSSNYGGLEQLLPLEQWGKEYYSVPMDANQTDNILPTWTQISAVEDNTLIKINERQVKIQRGRHFDTVAFVPLVIKADKPVQVTQLAGGMKSALLVPDSVRGRMGGMTFLQLLSQDKMQMGRTLYSSVPETNYPFKEIPYYLDYITVITATNEISEVFLDGKSIASSFRKFRFDSTMSFAQVLTEPWKHEIWSTGRYHLYAMGWSSENNANRGSYSNNTGIGVRTAISHAAPCLNNEFEIRGVAERGAIKWNWNFGDGTPEIESIGLGNTTAGDAFTKVKHTYTKAGTYSVRLRVLFDWSNGVEDTVMRDIVVNALPKPKITTTFPQDSVLCFGQSTRLKANLGFTSYRWSKDGEDITANPVTPQEIVVSKPGHYTVFVTDSNSCIGSTSLKIRVFELIAAIKGAKSTCLNSTEEYRAEGVISSGNKNIVVGWSATGGTLVSGQGTPIVGVRWTTQGTGLLKLEMRDAVTGCFKDTTISVEVGTGLNVAIDGNLTICEGTPTLLKAESGAGSDAIFEWSFNGEVLKDETGQTLLALKTGQYRVKVTSATGCIGEATAEVKASALPEKPIIAGQPILCDENSTTTLTLLKPENYLRYEWSFKNSAISTESKLAVSEVGIYSITVYNEAGCSAESEISVTQLVLKVTGDTTICSGAGVQLSAVSDAENIRYTWLPQAGLNNPGIANPIATPEVTTTYRVTLTTADGSCTRMDSVTITVLKAPEISTRDISLCEGESGELWAESDDEIVSWSWTPTDGLSNPNIQNPVVTAFKNETYFVTARSAGGCETTKALRLEVVPKENITAVLKSEKSELEPGEATLLKLLLKNENTPITAFKAHIKFDENVFQFTKNSGKFLKTPDNTWSLNAVIIAPGELEITANGQTPIAETEIAFELTVYLAKQASENIVLKIEEINGKVLKEEELCRTIKNEGTAILLKEVCAGDMRLVNVGEFQTVLKAVKPNPVSGNNIEIDYSVGLEGEIALEIYNAQGELLKTVFKGNRKAGVFKEIISTNEIPAGVFLLKLSTLQATQTQMFTLVK